ncbi:MAG TPA: hypothetical protein VNM46_13420 [Xanthobacteraceae bacterium]|jgi:hypothetical protein|nr:hypothetical protein [Xanthobacteraceae bacterium]
MRKFILMAFAGLSIMVAFPQAGSASPLMPAAGLATAADDVALTQDVRWHRHHYWHHRGWHHHYGWRHRHHWRHYGWRHRWHHRRHWARW